MSSEMECNWNDRWQLDVPHYFSYIPLVQGKIRLDQSENVSKK